MCGRSVLTLDPHDIMARTNVTRAIGQYQQSYNVTVGMVQPVIVASANEHIIQAMRWGGVSLGGAAVGLSNIRSDNKNGIFKSLLKKQRCLIIAEGFYEWKHTSDASKPLPYYFHIPNEQEEEEEGDRMISESDRFGGNDTIHDKTKKKKLIDRSKTMLLMAGVYQVNKGSDSDSTPFRYSVITTDASSEVSPVHHRMPVIFRSQDDINRWLSDSTTDEDSYKMMKQYMGLKSHRVPLLVNSIKNNGPELIAPEKEYYSKHGINRFFQPVQQQQPSQPPSSTPQSQSLNNDQESDDFEFQLTPPPPQSMSDTAATTTIPSTQNTQVEEDEEFDFFQNTPTMDIEHESQSTVNTQSSSLNSSSTTKSQQSQSSSTSSTSIKPTTTSSNTKKTVPKSPSKSKSSITKKSFKNSVVTPSGGGIERFFIKTN